MHASAIVCLALTLVAQAVPILPPRANGTIQRRSADYEVVNVGGDPSPVLPVVAETVTAPSPPQPTVTVYVSETPSPSSSPCSSSATPSPTLSILPVTSDVPSRRGLDRIAHMLGRSLEPSNSTDSRHHRRNNDTTAPTSRFMARGGGVASLFAARSNEAAHLNTRSNDTARLDARGTNVTEHASAFSRRSSNTTDSEDLKLKARGLNGSSLQARNQTRRQH